MIDNLKPRCAAAQLLICIFCSAAEDDRGSAARGVLHKNMGRFQLTGNTQPTLREVNGGRLCVNGFGKSPPFYHFSGRLSLDKCSAIAHEQPHSLGFRWGREGFDYGIYTSYARAMGGNQSNQVDLGLLFSEPGDFICTIYVALDSSGQPFAFTKSNLSEGFKPKLKDGPAHSVCFQRWTMTEFFRPFVSEIWFCYMPEMGETSCLEHAESFYTQGKIFVVVFVFFLAVLGWIMADMAEFETPLVWFTRFLLNMEFGLLSCGFLLEFWSDTEGVSFYLLAFIMDVAMAILAFVPYNIMEHINENSPFNTAYLLLMAFSPCFLMEFMSYWSHFILLVGHQPLLVGFVSFFAQYLFNRYRDYLVAKREEEDEGIARKASHMSIDQASYVSVPTDEPAECCNADHTAWLRCGDRLPRSCV